MRQSEQKLLTVNSQVTKIDFGYLYWNIFVVFHRFLIHLDYLFQYLSYIILYPAKIYCSTSYRYAFTKTLNVEYKHNVLYVYFENYFKDSNMEIFSWDI